MASKKKESEGISLLSMYGDDEDDDDVEEEEEEDVDFGHDDMSVSPKAEEGEILATGHAVLGSEPQSVNGTGTGTGTVQLLTPSTQSTPRQSSEHADQSQHDAMEYNKGDESESAEPEPINTTEDVQKEMDPLDNFLPPPTTMKCSDELQEKIIKFILLKKKTGRSFNSEVRNRKDYRNPDFLLHAVTYQDIDQIGSCFSTDVFNPHGYDKSDYYDEIEADLKRELERKEQEKKKNQKIDFLSGGTQSAVGISMPNVVPIPAVPPIAGGRLNQGSAAVDTGAREGRPNKKSKWDKVDGDRRHPLTTSGQDSVSSSGSHAVLMSTTNARTGYTAFAQQKRREAEERRSSDNR